MSTALMVIAKAPVPGRVKTRLCPPCTPEQAATLARAALQDTLAAAIETPADRHVCVLDGEPGPWLPAGFDVIAQRGDGLDERLAAAFADVGGRALLIGMDTPQVTAAQLGGAIATLERAEVDAVFGPALDGGYWAIGLSQPDADVFVGVPMSVETTGVRQQERLASRGLRVSQLDDLRDVDTIADAHLVAAQMPPTARFANALAALELQPAASVRSEVVA